MKELAHFSSIKKNFDGVTALDNFSCTLHYQEILGLIGPNGAGKTSLFNVITGLIPQDSGRAEFIGHNLCGLPPHRIANFGISRTFQNLRLIRQISVLENILLSFKSQPGENLFNVFFRSGLCEKQESANRERAHALLSTAGLIEVAHDLAENLSYGQQKLLALVCCLAADAKLLLLDEPVAGIAPEMADQILNIIANLPDQGKSAIVIEHDIDALSDVAHRMIFMDSGRKICEGTPDEVLNDSRVIEAYIS